ncbi:MAG TPA: sulfurtransferase TusA family protein [bacterium]|jgi:tRNA 2-thiouridine synthesizing protein A|nr:sulfurtransferase TusA family protein [bacterium]
MSNVIDARGLSCPQPVIKTLNGIKKIKKGRIVIMVDTDTAKENVVRAAQSQGWTVADIRAEGKGYRITIERDD